MDDPSKRASGPPELSPWEKRKDQLARLVIEGGALVIILAVLLIFFFLLKEAFPLFRGGKVSLVSQVRPEDANAALGVVVMDDYHKLALRLTRDGKVEALALEPDQQVPPTFPLELPGEVVAASFDPYANLLAAADGEGNVALLRISWKSSFDPERGRLVEPDYERLADFTLDVSRPPITRLAVGGGEEEPWVAALDSAGGLFLAQLTSGLFDSEVLKYNLTQQMGGTVSQLALSPRGDRLFALVESRELLAVRLGEEPRVESRATHPSPVTSLAVTVGGGSLMVGDKLGRLSRYLMIRQVRVTNRGPSPITVHGTLLHPGESAEFIDQDIAKFVKGVQGVELSPADFTLYRVGEEFPSLDSGVVSIIPSPASRLFVAFGEGGEGVMSHATSGKEVARIKSMPGPPVTGVINGKESGLLVMDRQGRLILHQLDPGHPETTIRTLFGKVWYEGYTRPEWVWQSTGGSDEFEAKLSLMPLIFGTMKGALYALLFALPVALFGALYLSQLAPQWLKNLFKPLIELMTALPTVVVGFLAGLWLAPLVAKNLVGTLLIFPLVPVALILFIPLVNLIPPRIRVRLPQSWELLPITLIALMAVWLALRSGPLIEATLFGGDVKLWLYQRLGMVYDPRNALIVGMAMGFAVIPIIFSLAEDALSAVPKPLISGAMALGATRWQTAWRVVLPAALPGVFAAVMLGFGRAVGETMIVLMATGNTPIIDMSPFNGFRTLSANIAVEVPEAPVGGTLYRVLFLSGLILFLFTFVINLIANELAARFRARYGRF